MNLIFSDFFFQLFSLLSTESLEAEKVIAESPSASSAWVPAGLCPRRALVTERRRLAKLCFLKKLS